MTGSPISEQDGPIAEINVVPLVDVILVVLIIFMVTAPLVLKPVIDVNLPEASSGQQDQITESMEVVINEVGHIFLDGQENIPGPIKRICSGPSPKKRCFSDFNCR